MALSEIDRSLIDRCVAKKPKAWNDFVDRFMGLTIHVINHTARTRSTPISAQDLEDLAADVFLEIIANDYAALRQFRGQSSLATYLTVIARRVVIRELLKRQSGERQPVEEVMTGVADTGRSVEEALSDREHVEQLLNELEGAEADVVRLYHLEGKSYYEISMATGMPENSIGPMLSRARGKLRRAGVEGT